MKLCHDRQPTIIVGAIGIFGVRMAIFFLIFFIFEFGAKSEGVQSAATEMRSDEVEIDVGRAVQYNTGGSHFGVNDPYYASS